MVCRRSGAEGQQSEVHVGHVLHEKLIRFNWDGDEDPEAYCEMKIEIGEITNDCVLVITDFAEADDLDSLRELWDDNMESLHQATGL